MRATNVLFFLTANGRLSFRHIGETRRRTFLRYANTVDDAHCRFVLGLEKRNLSDLLFRKVTELISGRSGALWFIVDFRSSDIKVGNLDALEGAVRIYKPQYLRKLVSNSHFFNALHQLHQHHIGLEKILDLSVFAQKALGEVPAADITIEFVLFRDGEIRMKQPTFADTKIAEASEFLAEERGVSFRQWAANQAYFFVRDLCHVHQHHRPELDTIIILQDDDGDELRWRNHVLYSMHHYVIRMRRSLQRQDLYRGIGVLAYAKAFRGVYDVRRKQAQQYLSEPLSTFQEDAIE